MPRKKGKQVKNDFVDFNTDEVAEHILASEQGGTKADEFAKQDAPETIKTQEVQKSKHGNEKCGGCKKQKKDCDCGRNPVINENVLRLLYMAFCMNYTDEQACLYSGIGTATLYRYQDKNPEFRERKVLLRNSTKMYAKANIFKSLVAGDVENSKWLLERLEKNEYSRKDVVENTSIITLRDPLRERLVQLKQMKKEKMEARQKRKDAKSKATKPKKKRIIVVKK